MSKKVLKIPNQTDLQLPSNFQYNLASVFTKSYSVSPFTFIILQLKSFLRVFSNSILVYDSFFSVSKFFLIKETVFFHSRTFRTNVSNVDELNWIFFNFHKTVHEIRFYPTPFFKFYLSFIFYLFIEYYHSYLIS